MKRAPQVIGTSPLAQIPLCIAVIDREFTIVEANRTFEQIYGDWSERKCYEAYKGRDTQCPACAAVKTFRDRKTRTFEEERRDAKGKIHHYMVHISALEHDDETGPCVIEVSTDITDRVKIEKKYRLLFDHVPCYVAVINRNYRVLDANELFRETFQRKGAHYCYEMYKGRNKVCSRCPAIKVFKSKQPHTSFQVGMDKYGKKTRYMVTAAPLVTAGDTVDSVIEISQDISQIMLLQEQLKQMEQEKLDAERLAAVGQTVAGLSHGVKNILTGLEGGVYVVNSGLKKGDNELVASGWTMLQNNITKISTVVEEYLKFARGSGIKVEMTQPARIAEEVFHSYDGIARQSGIGLIADVQGTVCEAPLDAEGIRTCLAHIVSNAIDACTMSDKKKKRVVLSCKEKDGTIVYEVEDNGTGIEYEVRKKVFKSFFTTKTSGQGTGLGLLITRRIVHEHGGKVSFESSPGSGSRFKMELPRGRLPRIPTQGTHPRSVRGK